MLFIEETLWAKKQLETNFDNSEEALLVYIIFSDAKLYNLFKFDISMSLSLTPITILSGFNKSYIAVPYAKNSGLLAIVYLFLFSGIVIAEIIL